MGNPAVRTTDSALRFRIYYASEEGAVFADAPTKLWVDRFKIDLKAWWPGPITLDDYNIGAPGAANAADAGGVNDESQKHKLRERADDLLVVYTPDLMDRPRDELKVLVDSLKQELSNPDLRPLMWVVKLDRAPFGNIDIGKVPVWHELKGQAAKGERFFRTNEDGWKDEMSEAAKTIATHRSCQQPLTCCPRHAAGATAPDSPAQVPGLFSRLFSRLFGGRFGRG